MNNFMRAQLFTLAVTMALLIAFALCLALPRSHTLVDVRQKTSNLQTQNENLARENATITTRHQEVVLLEREVQIAQGRVPARDHFAEYENDLLRLGEEAGLWAATSEPEIIDLTRRDTDSEKRIKVRSMKLKFPAEFDRFYEFLQAVESQTRLTRIDDITITPLNQFSNAFTIEMRLSIFHGRL